MKNSHAGGGGGYEGERGFGGGGGGYEGERSFGGGGGEYGGCGGFGGGGEYGGGGGYGGERREARAAAIPSHEMQETRLGLWLLFCNSKSQKY